MSAVAHEQPIADSPSQEDILLESFLSLHSPEGFRAELIEERSSWHHRRTAITRTTSTC